MSDLAAALAALQADLPRIKRTATGQTGTRRYKYPPYDEILAAVRPIMAKHQIVWHTEPGLWVVSDEGARFALRYTLYHLPTGDAVIGYYPLKESAAQQQGAEISYAKRYTLVAVLDLEVEGEDSDAMDTPTRQPVRSQTTGPEHERLRQGLHEATPEQAPADRGPLPAGEDVWQDQPPGLAPINDPEDKPRTVQKRQLDAMHAKFGELGIIDRGERLTMTRRLLDLDDIPSSKELSYRQAGRLLQALQELTNSRGKS